MGAIGSDILEARYQEIIALIQYGIKTGQGASSPAGNAWNILGNTLTTGGLLGSLNAFPVSRITSGVIRDSIDAAGNYTQLMPVTWKRTGNNSYTISQWFPDLNLANSNPTTFATIPVPLATPATKNASSRFDYFGKIVNATDTYSVSLTGEWQNINGVITAVGSVTTNRQNATIGAGSFVASMTVVGTNVVISVTGAAGAQASGYVQIGVGQST